VKAPEKKYLARVAKHGGKPQLNRRQVRMALRLMKCGYPARDTMIILYLKGA
jgi:hypothetical protein